MEFASKFVQNTIPIIIKIKEAGFRVYIRGLRQYEDGVVPKSVFVPGLKGALVKELATSLFEYDNPDTDFRDTHLLTYDKVSTDGWSEL